MNAYLTSHHNADMLHLPFSRWPRQIDRQTQNPIEDSDRLWAAPGLSVRTNQQSYTVLQADINNAMLHTDTCCIPAWLAGALLQKEQR